VIAREIARIGRTDFFNSTRRVDDENEDLKVSKIKAKDVYALRNLGMGGASDKRIINVLNVQRKSLHPPIFVTGQEATQARSPMTSAVVPTPWEKMKETLEEVKAEASLGLSSKSRETPSQTQKGPFDNAVNTGSGFGFGAAAPVGLRACTAKVGGHASWLPNDNTAVLSPDKRRIHRLVGPNGAKYLSEMYTRDIYNRISQFDHWANLRTPPPTEPEADLLALASNMSQLSVAANISGAEDVPHYLTGNEQGVLRQAINDMKLQQTLKGQKDALEQILKQRAAAAEKKELRKIERAKARAREANLKMKMVLLEEKARREAEEEEGEEEDWCYPLYMEKDGVHPTW
jgi:hypothetical protein